MAAGLDPQIPSGQPEELAALFRSGGADVTISWRQARRGSGTMTLKAPNIGGLAKHSTKNRRPSSAEMLVPRWVTDSKPHTRILCSHYDHVFVCSD